MDLLKRYGSSWDDPSVLDDSEPPMTQPGLWCDRVPAEDRHGIEWNVVPADEPLPKGNEA